MRGTFLGIIVFLASQTFTGVAAYAGLGLNESSIDQDYDSLTCVSKTSTDFSNYHVINLTTDTEIMVKEYVNPLGIIFAVTTSGITQPDLKGLLGKYNAEFRAAREKGRLPGRRLATTVSSNVIVEEGGHMRSSITKAWIPKLLPEGMSINEIQ